MRTAIKEVVDVEGRSNGSANRRFSSRRCSGREGVNPADGIQSEANSLALELLRWVRSLPMSVEEGCRHSVVKLKQMKNRVGSTSRIAPADLQKDRAVL